MKKILSLILLLICFYANAQTTPAIKIRSNSTLTEVDHYATILKRLGIPTGDGDDLETSGSAQNSIKLRYNRTLNKLRIYDPITGSWKDAGSTDLSNYYKKNNVDSLLDSLKTTDINEGTKLFFNNTRARSAILSTYSTGAIPFGNGTNLSVNSSNLFWDNSTNRFGLGTVVPVTPIEINTTSPALTFTPSIYSGSYRTQLGVKASAEGVLLLGNNGDNEVRFGNTAAGGSASFYVNNTHDLNTATDGTLFMKVNSAGKVGILNPTPTEALDVIGKAKVSLAPTSPTGVLRLMDAYTKVQIDSISASAVNDKGILNGISTLDSNATLPIAQLNPNVVVRNLIFNEGDLVSYAGHRVLHVGIDSTKRFLAIKITDSTGVRTGYANYISRGFYGIYDQFTIDASGVPIPQIIEISVAGVDERWFGKKIVHFGDSNTNFALYAPQIALELGVNNVIRGVSGSSMSGPDADSGYKQARINTIPVDADVVFIAMGTNDYNKNYYIYDSANPSNLNSLDSNCFVGAYNLMLNRLIARSPSARIVLCTTSYGENLGFITNEYPVGSGRLPNNPGYDTADFAKAVRQIAKNRRLPISEEQRWGHADVLKYCENETWYGYKLHLNQNGADEWAWSRIGTLKNLR